MGFMALGAVRDLAVYFVAERTGLFGMGGLVIGEVLARPLMAGETRFFYVIGKVQGQWFMGIGVTGQAVFQLEMRPAFMAHGTLGDNVLTPWRMLLVTVKTGDGGLMLAPVAGNCCRFILVAFDAVRHLERNPFRFRLMNKSSQHESDKNCRAQKTK